MLSRLLLARSIRNHTDEDSGDPYWDSVLSLIHFEGSSGSTTIVDEKGLLWTCAGTTQVSSTYRKFGVSSLAIPTQSSSNKLYGPSNLSPFSGDFTVEFFVYPILGSTSYTPMFFGVDHTSTRGVQIGWDGVNNGQAALSVVGGSAIISPAGAIVTNQWNWIACSVKGNIAYLTVNNTFATGAWIPGSGNPALPMTFGTHVNGITNMTGYFDEFRLTKGVCRYTSLAPIPLAPFPNHK